MLNIRKSQIFKLGEFIQSSVTKMLDPKKEKITLKTARSKRNMLDSNCEKNMAIKM